MAASRTISVEIDAYLWSELYGPQDLQADPERVASFLSYRNDKPSAKYVKVGRARITVELIDERAIVDNKVEALKEEKREVLATAQAKATQIEKQIQSLLAITCDVEA
jgi:hypothetical protein